MNTSFHNLGLDPILVDTVEKLGYIEPTPIQRESIPHLLQNRDVLGQAQTGTGKTAAFTLPTLQRLDADALQVLILTPTRELAIQDAEAVFRYGNQLGLRVLPIYGGQSYDRQVRRLQKGVHVVVGTPGRTLDLIRQRALDLRDVKYLILDEADEMLKMGFIEDIEQIIGATNADQRQTILFSATFSSEIRKLAHKYMRDPLHIEVESEQVTAENIVERHYVVNERDKMAALCRLLEVEDQQNTLIFARTKVGAAELAEMLMLQGFPAVAIHGDLSQQERERILGRFRAGESKILVATDVMARGVDIPAVSHVINYDIPQLAIEYVHRIGRTGRAGRSGEAITLITPKQRRALGIIENYVGHKIERAQLPTRDEVLQIRNQGFATRLIEQIDASSQSYDDLLDELLAMGYSAEQVANGLIQMLRAQEATHALTEISDATDKRQSRRERRSRNRQNNGERAERNDRSDRGDRRPRKGKSGQREEGMVRLYMNIGRSNGVKPGDVVYKIASNANIPGSVIGAIDIQQDGTYVDIPEDYVSAVIQMDKNAKIRGQSMKLKMA